MFKPKTIRKSTSLWGEHFAAEAASQIAMWIHVSSSDFPALEWATLESNVLAHYVDHPYHIMLVITLYPILKASLTRAFTDASTSYTTMDFCRTTPIKTHSLHELLHAFNFGEGNTSEIEASWHKSFDSSVPSIQNYHWSTDAEGFHRRTFLPADKEVYFPSPMIYLFEFTHLFFLGHATCFDPIHLP